MKLKKVMRYDDRLHMFRLFRILLWKRDNQYRAKLSFAVWPRIFNFSKGWREWDLTVLGLRLHYLSGGGGMV